MTGRKPRYPVYVISKGRADTMLTAKFLVRDKVPFKIVVEPQEQGLYEESLATFDQAGIGAVAVLPFSNLGQGSIPARNWVWEDAKAAGHARHWILDDNMRCVRRLYNGHRYTCASGPAFLAIETFVDRYTNIGIAGMNYEMFGFAQSPPFYLNAHVYSCILIDNNLPIRWRGRYNEDTDLCLQTLAIGLCTVLVNAFLVRKQPTMTMTGGNTTELYKGDGRARMARSLERLWPGVVETTRLYGRPAHLVRWDKFRTPLIRRTDIDWDNLPETDEFGFELFHDPAGMNGQTPLAAD